MNQPIVQTILQQVADQHGVPAEEVVREIEAAINAGWNHPDPMIHLRWRSISPDGEPPSVDAALAALVLLTLEISSRAVP